VIYIVFNKKHFYVFFCHFHFAISKIRTKKRPSVFGTFKGLPTQIVALCFSYAFRNITKRLNESKR